jgi:hypothetical protein
MEESRVGFNMAVAEPALIEGELDHVISASSTNEDYVLSSSGEPWGNLKNYQAALSKEKVMRDTSLSSGLLTD